MKVSFWEARANNDGTSDQPSSVHINTCEWKNEEALQANQFAL